jgi:citrate synthase
MCGKYSEEQISKIVDEVIQQLQKPKDIKDTGLRGIKIAHTNVCLIKGEDGQLYYRGYSVNDLAENSSYEEVVYLLLYRELPNVVQLEEFRSNLISNRELSREIIEQLQRTPKNAPPMSVLQSALALLASYDPELANESEEANRRRAIRIIAKVPVIAASWERIRNNQSPIAPNKNLSHAANFLYMLTGKKPAKDVSRIFDVDLILHAEHSFNASTFTARVIASTGADMYAAISGAIGSLSGKLHGGAVSHVMRNLLEIGDVSNVDDWVKNQFDSGKRIMGMGHAVYKTMDPRATIIKGMAERLIQENKDIDSKFFYITNKIVEVTQSEFTKRKGRQIHPNVDLYSPSVYSAIRIPKEIFAPIFVISRVAGWAAHVLEQLHPESPDIKPMLYRPSADYAGRYCDVMGCPFTPLERRNANLNEKSLTREVVGKEMQGIQRDQLVHSVSRSHDHISEEEFITQEKDLITEIDVREMGRLNLKKLFLASGAVITPLARDRARKLGIDIITK